MLEILKRKDWPESEVRLPCEYPICCLEGCPGHLLPKNVIGFSKYLKTLTDKKLAEATKKIEMEKQAKGVDRCKNGLDCKFYKKGTCKWLHLVGEA